MQQIFEHLPTNRWPGGYGISITPHLAALCRMQCHARQFQKAFKQHLLRLQLQATQLASLPCKSDPDDVMVSQQRASVQKGGQQKPAPQAPAICTHIRKVMAENGVYPKYLVQN